MSSGILSTSARPLLLGHRGAGAKKSIPENTFASFDQALAYGCDGFEFDVRMTSDKEAVVCHDPHSKGAEIARSAGAEVPHLPRLEEICRKYRRIAFLNIELKVEGLEKMVTTLLSRFKMSRGVIVSSFLPEVLRNLQARDERIPLGLICETSAQLEQWRLLPLAYVIPRQDLVDEALIRDVHAAGRKLLAWTVNDRKKARQFASMGVDGIISDDPKMITETFKAGR